MRKKSIKINAILNFVKTFMSFIFPLITFPYASRVLLPDGIGRVNFATSIISYFSLLASLGITSYGIREGAKIRESRYKLSKFAKEIFTINMIATIVSYVLLIVAIIFIQKFNEYKQLLIICSASILFTTLGMDWLYTAVEDFAYITIRSIVFQFISLILLFLFVHTPNDILQYAAISVVSNVGSNFLNFIHSRKYISFKNIKVKMKNLKKHVAPVTVLFVMAITSSIYTILDTSMLGFLTTDYQVGIYTAATKINRIVLNLVVSIGTVLLPRLSYYSGVRDNKKFLELAYKSIDLLMLIAVPAAVGLSILAKDIILIISGQSYIAAVPVMRIINPIVIIVAVSNFIGVQIFMPLNKEKWTLYSNIAGAIVNLTLNIILITKYGAIGAAIASMLAELIVTGTQMFLVRKYLSVKKIGLKIGKYSVMSLIMGICVYCGVRVICKTSIISVIVGAFIGIFIYFLELCVTRNEWITMVITSLKGKINASKKNNKKLL